MIKPEENNFTIIDVSDAFLKLLNIKKNKVLGKKPGEVYSKFPGINQAEFTENMVEELQTLSSSKKNGYQGEPFLYLIGKDSKGKKNVLINSVFRGDF